jgi:hypothetical protein
VRRQPFDRIADPQQRAAGKREDQLGIGAEKFGVAVVVAIAGAVLLFARVVAPGAVVVAGMVIGRDPLAHTSFSLRRAARTSSSVVSRRSYSTRTDPLVLALACTTPGNAHSASLTVRARRS